MVKAKKHKLSYYNKLKISLKTSIVAFCLQFSEENIKNKKHSAEDAEL